MSNTVFSQGQIGDFFELRHGFAFPGSAFSDEGELLVVKIKNIKPGRLDLSKQEFIPADYLATHGGYMPKAGDLLVSLSGNRYEGNPETWVGKVCLYTGAPRCLINQRVGILRKKEGVEIDSRYFSYLLSTLDAQQSLIQIATSSGGQANLSTKQLLDFEVLVAPPADQKAIAHILGTLDDKIELNRKTNETLEAMAKALFKSWFVDFDPVRAKAEGRPTGLPAEIGDLFPDSFEDSELGEIPSGWKISNLGSLITQCGEPTQASPATRELPYVPIDCISSKSLSLCDYKSGLEANTSLLRFREGDILFGAMRPYFHKVCIAPFHGTTRTTCFALRPFADSHYGFAVMLLSAASTIEYATLHSTGSTIPYIRWLNGLENMLFIQPPDPILDHFSKAVLPILRKASTSLFTEKPIADIREILLPKLISGEIRIPDAERMLEEVGV